MARWDERVEGLARLLKPAAFEKTSGMGHQEFAEEDRKEREAARAVARETLDQARNQERQRIQEALEGRIREYEYRASSQSAYRQVAATYRLVIGDLRKLLSPTDFEVKAATPLDTLDPSGEEKLPAPQTDNLPAKCDGSGQFEAFMGEQAVRVDCGGCSRCHPSGEQGEGSDEDWPGGFWITALRRNREIDGEIFGFEASDVYVAAELRRNGHGPSRRYVPATDTSKEER